MSWMKIIESIGVGIIMNALFDHYTNKQLNNKSYDKKHVNKMNNILPQIIQDREEKDDDDENVMDLKLDNLALPLITNISLFLNQSDCRVSFIIQMEEI